MTRIRVHSALVSPEFLAISLHFLWAAGYSRNRAKRWVSQAAIDVPTLLKFRIPLPVLPEQQRIVEILGEMRGLDDLFAQRTKILARLKQALFVNFFGSPVPQMNSKWDSVRIGDYVEIAAGGTPPRENPENFGTRFPWVKSTDLTDSLIEATEEALSDLGYQRCNAKLLPPGSILVAMYGQGQTRGRTGKLAIEACCNQACAALLPSEAFHPDYLWLWLQLSYDFVRSLGRGGQQENLNLGLIRGIRIPKPPMELQDEFARHLREFGELGNAIARSRDLAGTSLRTMVAEALAGRLTTDWREQHHAELEAAARERDGALGSDAGRIQVRITEHVPTERATGFARPHRQALVNQLSIFQHEVWNTLRFEWRGAVLADDPAGFEDFCTSPQTAWRLERFNAAPAEVRRALEQLAAVGLVRKMSLPSESPSTGRTDFLTAFRPLREDSQGGRAEEDMALQDADRVQQRLAGRTGETR